MTRRSVSMAAVSALTALAIATCASAQDKQLYKYTDADGRVVYTDKPPPVGSKNVQPKRLNANVIETNELPLASQIATEKYPVTLYTFKCGDLCENAEALLNRRGVPFTTVNVGDQQGAAKLHALTGENSAPVLQVGDKLIGKGFNEQRWQAMLDEAGYPKAPPTRRVNANRGAPDATTRAEIAPGAPNASGAPNAPGAANPAGAPNAAAPAAGGAPAGSAAGTPATPPPATDGGYPKN
jgi:glutaredoxin